MFSSPPIIRLTTLTFTALHGNRIVSTPFQTIVEEDTQKIATNVSVHTLTFHETYYPLHPPGHSNKIQYLIPVNDKKGQTHYFWKTKSKTLCFRERHFSGIGKDYAVGTYCLTLGST